MEEEEEEGVLAPSDLGGVPWIEAVRIHRLLKGDLDGDSEGEDEAEEQSESSYASALRIRQIISPIDPLEIKADVHWTHITGQEGERSTATSQPEASDAPPFRNDAVRAWLDSLSREQHTEVELSPDDDEEEEDDDGAVFEDDIASDAEAENLMISYTEELEQLVREKEEACGVIGIRDDSKREHQVNSGSNMDLRLTSDTAKEDLPEQEGEVLSLEVPFVKPVDSERGSAASQEVPSSPSDVSPVRSQPQSFPQSASPCSTVHSEPAVSPLAHSPGIAPAAVCCQPVTSPQAASPITAQSPVKVQPVSTILTSTPVIELSQEQDTAAAGGKSLRKDPVDEFWLRSMELRKSLGVSPVERTSGSDTSFTLSTTGSASPQSFTPEEMFEEQRSRTESLQPPCTPPSAPGIEEQPLPALTSSQSTGLDAKSSGGGQRDLTSTSGLGLNGSLSNTRTGASESLNNSDSMLTPPSSPPPPPPADEEPATLRRRKYQDRKQGVTDSTAQLSTEQPASAPHTQSDTIRKSLAESIDEIPFADDVEDTYDDQTPDTSVQERFYTPPSSQPRKESPSPALSARLPNASHPKVAAAKPRLLPHVSAEAKEIAEERMRAREKSVKSHVLRDAMEKQLKIMKEMEVSEEDAGQCRSVRTHGSAQEQSWADSTFPSQLKLTNGQKLQPQTALDSSGSPAPVPDRVWEGSGASSEDSAGKTKKRTSLFSPRKGKKEKKLKSDGRHKAGSASDELAKPKSLWKSVFSSYRKERKKKERPCPSTPSSSNTVHSSSKHTRDILRTAAELQLGQHLSFSEDSDLSNDDVLERNSQRSRRESVYVPHALAFRRSYIFKKPYTEEELNSKLTRRVQKAARRQAKQEELKRLHRAQIIQRQLEQVEEKQRQLEERGVAVEKALRGEADYWGESSYSEILDLHLGVEALVEAPRRRPLSFCHCCTHNRGMGKKDDPRLMQEWFKLVQEKNSLVRYESELMIFARELELEDRQSRLQQELRERMAVDDNLKSSDELAEEKQILNEMLEVVEQRDSLVALLEEQRLREKEEDKDLEAVMLSKSYNLNWS
ncbi:F-actin-monooxygenase MICAL3-like [Scyliorhinus canicula]|uniref:F-actin-monooxygenase MICAL3-like n=1 Tax=Scyliorhinus canicula TaxID=7830 RepID=UPI0018F5D0AF|nr:F-actin-monooxygenase MICAL3-like [Scyliorhinus canicula]